MTDETGSASGTFACLGIDLHLFESGEIVIDGGDNRPPSITATDPAAVNDSDRGTTNVVTLAIGDIVSIDDPEPSDIPVSYAGGLTLLSTTSPAAFRRFAE